LVGLTALAFALRIVGANSGLWIDEIYALVLSIRPSLAQITTVFHHDNHHPLYAVLAHLSWLAFGESPWAIRLPSILVGTASVPLLYALARRVAAPREAFGAALLLAVSYHHVWFSQNARGYVLLAAATMAGTALLLDLFQRPRAGPAIAFGIVAGLGAYTHLTMVFIVVGQALACALPLWRPPAGTDRVALLRTLVLAFATAAGTTLLLYAPMLGQVVDHFVNRPSGLVGVSTPVWALIESLRVLALGFGAGKLLLGGVVVAAGGVIFLAGVVSYGRQRPEALALFLMPGLTILAGALAARGTMYPRFFFALAGPALLIAVRGIVVATHWITERFPARPGAGTRLATVALGGLAVLSLLSLSLNYRHPKQDFGGAVAFVEANRATGDAAAVTGVATFAVRDYLGRDWPTLDDAGALEQLRRSGPVWLVWTFPRYLERTAPALLATLVAECPEAARFPGTIGGGDVHACRLEPLP